LTPGARSRAGGLQGPELDGGEPGGLRAEDRACVEQQGRWVPIHGGIHEDHAVRCAERDAEGATGLRSGGQHGQREQTPCTRRVPGSVYPSSECAKNVQ